MTAISQTNVPIETLRSWLTGDVIAPGDERYDEARSVFAPGIDRRPAAIVRPVDALEVAFVVMLAKVTGTGLAVRGGGHSSPATACATTASCSTSGACGSSRSTPATVSRGSRRG